MSFQQTTVTSTGTRPILGSTTGMHGTHGVSGNLSNAAGHVGNAAGNVGHAVGHVGHAVSNAVDSVANKVSGHGGASNLGNDSLL